MGVKWDSIASSYTAQESLYVISKTNIQQHFYLIRCTYETTYAASN
jgi:hypothetical protein